MGSFGVLGAGPDHLTVPVMVPPFVDLDYGVVGLSGSACGAEDEERCGGGQKSHAEKMLRNFHDASQQSNEKSVDEPLVELRLGSSRAPFVKCEIVVNVRRGRALGNSPFFGDSSGRAVPQFKDTLASHCRDEL